MLRIAIDGACRRNGQIDCVAAGGVLICTYEDGKCIASTTTSVSEQGSTNQRGEMLALISALTYIKDAKQDAQIITDSEYLFNAMTKEWWQRWSMNSWKTVAGTDVKNADLWKVIAELAVSCKQEVSYYHIKGHCISFGTVTATRMLEQDTSSITLGKAVSRKYDECIESRAKELAAAQDLSEKNNGFRLEPTELKKFVVMNTVADAIATRAVDIADAGYSYDDYDDNLSGLLEEDL